MPVKTTDKELQAMLKQSKENLKNARKMINTANKVNRAIKSVGLDKEKVIQHLLIKHTPEQVNELIKDYVIMFNFENWRS